MSTTIKNLRQGYENKMIRYLTKEGARIAFDAFKSVSYKADTNNLDDSFVWGVYNHGKLVEGAFGCVQPQEAIEPKKWYGKELYGHDLAMSFLRTFRPIKKGYALVVAAVMPYGRILEEKYKYRVIATAREEMRQMAGSMKNSRTRIIHLGKAE